MNRRKHLFHTSVLSFLFAVAAGVLLAGMIDLIRLNHTRKLFACVILTVCGYAIAYLRAVNIPKTKARRRAIKGQLSFLFVVYLIMLADFTLVDGSLGRNVLNVLGSNGAAFLHHIKTNTNLIPFATVRLFVNAYRHGTLSTAVIIENLLGNLVAFMPLAFFLPCLYKGMNRWYTVLGAVLGIVITVEILQFLLLTGSSDIDDVILNTAGAMACYGVLRLPPIQKGLSKMTFGVWKNCD